MTSLRVLLSRVVDVVRRRSRERRLNTEIQDHLDELTQDYLSQGLAPADARAAARRSFGNIERMTEEHRDQRGLPAFDTLLRDLRFAVRLLRRDRGFAATAALVLAVGIGVNNMQFTILNAHTIRGLPIDRVDRVVYISTLDERLPDRGFSYPELDDLQARARSFSAIGAFSEMPLVIAGDGQAADRMPGAFVSPGALETAGTRPLIGRGFTADDDKAGVTAVALLTRAAWQARYGADPSVLGRSILINGRPATIVGVVPDRSGVPTNGKVWVPLRQVARETMENRSARPLRVFARLRDGVDLRGAGAEVDTIVATWFRDHPDASKSARGRVIPVNERFLGSTREPAWRAFMLVGCMVVLISCANVANLMLAHTAQRTRELAIRAALGASRGRVVRQLLIEGSLLAALGGALGLGFALAGLQVFRAAIPADALPYWLDYSLDRRVLTMLVAVSALTILIFALIPAMKASRTDVNSIIKDGGSRKTGRARQGWATMFLAAEFGLAVVLLANFAVALRTIAPELPVDSALDTSELVTASITLPAGEYRSPADRAEFYRTLTERLRGIPLITSAAIANVLPLGGGEDQQLAFPGQQRAGDPPSVVTVTIGPGYFATLGMPLVKGRDLVDGDGTPGNGNVVVNEYFVTEFLDGREPLGQQIALTSRQSSEPTSLTIVGVVPAIRQRPRSDATSVVYRSHGGAPPPNAVLIVRSAADTAALTAALRQEVAAIDPHLPLYRIRTMEQVRREANWNGRLSNRFFIFLMFTAVALATFGLYAVTAHGVSQSSREIGVRMALGARPRQLIALIGRRVAGQVAIGFAAGVLCTKIWSSKFPSGDAELTATDPASLAIVLAILTIVAILASVVPLWRATHLDPVAAIREA